MIIAEVKTNRFRDWIGRFAKLTGANVAEHSRDHLRNAGRITVEALRRFAPVGQPDPLGRPPRPGYRKLNENIRFRTHIVGASMRLRFYAPPQFIWTTRGTRPHRIPKRPLPYPLRFFWPRVGRVVYFMSVDHPGNKGDRWDRRAMDTKRSEVRTELRRGFLLGAGRILGEFS